MLSTDIAPSTPDDRTHRLGTSQRASLGSARVRTPSQPASARDSVPEIGAADGIETLFVHPNSRVVKFFTGTATSSRPGTSGSSNSVLSPRETREAEKSGAGTLPWKTSSEQTMAVGPLEIYRVPGSVSFVRSNSLLHAIMPRTQCWCVDGVSTFVVRVATDTYYRIELPGAEDPELDQVEKFKLVLQKVLHYERTACPFAREFTVDLPDEPRPERRRRRTTHGPAKKWKLARAHTWRPEDGEEPMEIQDGSDDSATGSAPISDDELQDEEDEEGLSVGERLDKSPSPARLNNEIEAEEDQVRTPKYQPTRRPTVRERIAGFTNKRSFTAPPQINSHASVPLRLRGNSNLEEQKNAGRQFEAGASALQTEQSAAVHRTHEMILTTMPPSPPGSSTENDSGDVATTVASQDQENHPFQPISGEAVRDDSELPLQDKGSESDIIEDLASEGTAQIQLPVPATKFSRPLQIAEEEEEETTEVDVPEEELEMTHFEHDLRGRATGLNPHDEELNITKEMKEPSADVKSPLPQPPLDSHLSDTTTSPTFSAPPTTPKPDPYAEIQARINARRSIGATPSPTQPPLRSHTSRLANHQRHLSTKASLPILAQHLQNRQHDTPLTSAAVTQMHRAYELFFVAWAGPPKHLAQIMLRIAQRLADGAAEGLKGLKSTPRKGEIQRVPGSFDLVEEGWDEEDDEIEDDEQAPVEVEEQDA